jgi:nucleotide-binding universal stress UspA family protein
MTYATILVNLEAGRPNAHVLDVAGTIAERFQAGVIGSTACATLQVFAGDGYIDGEIFEADRNEIARETAAAKAEFHAALAGRARIVGWRSAELVTSLASHLANLARGADLVVTGAGTAEAFNAARQISLGDLVMQVGRPVLVVAPRPARFATDHVMIAWKDTREARRAAADALPLIQAAGKVSLVEIAAKDDIDAARSRLREVADWLLRHGVTAVAELRRSTGDDAAGLDEMADEMGADILVAGAYGHTRLREWALGGVTRGLLGHGARCCCVSH